MYAAASTAFRYGFWIMVLAEGLALERRIGTRYIEPERAVFVAKQLS
jgi:hypothetical protein